MTTVVSVTIQSQWDEAECPTMEIQTRQELLLDEYDTTKGREGMNGLDAWIWGKFNQGNHRLQDRLQHFEKSNKKAREPMHFWSMFRKKSKELMHFWSMFRQKVRSLYTYIFFNESDHGI